MQQAAIFNWCHVDKSSWGKHAWCQKYETAQYQKAVILFVQIIPL